MTYPSSQDGGTRHHPPGPLPPGYQTLPAGRAQKPKRSPWLFVGLGGAGVLALCMGIGAIGAISDPQGSASTGGRTAATATAKDAADVEQATEQPKSKAAPEPAQFQLSAKITRKKCFGSAGCNVTFHPDVTYTGPALDPADTWTVIYEIQGVEDGPEVGHLEMTGTKYGADEEEVSTPSGSSKITLKVTGVEAS